MLRLPPFRFHRPETLEQALEALGEHEGDVLPMAGGTDLVPNMKHGLFTPGHVVGLKGVREMGGIREEDGHLVIGATETLSSVASDERVRRRFPALAEAAGHVAGPQLRNQGTIGGNLCLDTRCTYYNQTRFWRKSLGFCLKKDGDVCHVTKVGRKCVAAHSADTPPVLMTLGAVAEVASPEGGRREIPLDEFFVPDGVRNTRLEPGELVVAVRVPLPEEGLRTGYAKLRQRRSIDFPLLTVAVAATLDGDRVRDIRGVVTALGSRPKELTGWDDIAEGEVLDDEVVEALAERAHQQCRPLENIVVDPEWRRAMVPVQVRKALRGMAASA